MDEWKKKRLTGITGSDASAILGLNPYISNIDIWKIKTGKIELPNIDDKDCIQYGKNMEPVLIDLFKIDNPQYQVFHKDYDLRKHKEYDYLLGSLDGELINDEKKHGVLEIKTTTIRKYSDFEKWKDKIPDNYYCQVLHYLLCTSFDFAVIFALLKHQNGLEIKKYDIQRESVKEEIEYLKNKEIEFWNEFVLKDKQPPLILPQI